MSARWLGLCLLVYAPHLVEEHALGMHDDPLIVFAFDHSLAALPARDASYLVFQIMMAATLTAAYLASLGGRARDALLFVLGLALVGESHHLIRAALTLHYDAGAVTSVPMPFVGVAILVTLVARARAARRATAASPTGALATSS